MSPTCESRLLYMSHVSNIQHAHFISHFAYSFKKPQFKDEPIFSLPLSVAPPYGGDAELPDRKSVTSVEP